MLTIPREFVWRRLHSLMGLGFVLFLSEHLLTNSQAAWGEGQRFVRLVNAIHNLPGLRAIELTLIGVPILIHVVWGIRYALTSQSNSACSDGSVPSIRTFRNRAYTWQRWTAWVLIGCLLFHVVTMRFLYYPEEIRWKSSKYYATRVFPDARMSHLADRLGVLLYDAHLESSGFLNQLDVMKLQPGEMFAVSQEFGAVCLLSVRNTLNNPLSIAFYTLFVVLASFHAFNGLWTSLITWGWVWKAGLQRLWSRIILGLMLVFILLGLIAIWS